MPFTESIMSKINDTPRPLFLNTLRPRQNGCNFPDNILKCIFMNENIWILIEISLKFVLKVPIANIPALVQIMAWRRPGDQPLSESMMVSLLTNICITWPPWIKVPGKVYTGCVRSAMLHSNKMWGPNTDLEWLCHNDCAMICWICGTKHQEETLSASLLQKLGIKEIAAVLHGGWLRWYGHVQRATSCIRSVIHLTLPGRRRRGSPRKTLSECGKTDVSEYGLAGTDPQHRDAWRASVKHSLVLIIQPTPLDETQTAP